VRNAIMIMLRVITFEAWTWPMYALFSSFPSYFVVAYFGFAVVFGGFFVVNLFLAVILKARGIHVPLRTVTTTSWCVAPPYRDVP
jgi:hypothetical protein